MATSGGQPGNQNALKSKRWISAVDRALAKRSKAAGIEELDRLADKFLDEVEAEGINGYKELADRLDGKPHQTQDIEHKGDLHVGLVDYTNAPDPT